MNHNIPFKVGQNAEAKSFEKGYRGAWFRCKIMEITHRRRGHVSYALEYFDYPEEKIHSLQLYQTPPSDRLSQKRHLMLRPSFPTIYHESQKPDECNISEVIAVVDGTWKVGDLVDWKKDDCYWSGRITHIVNEDKMQVELLKPPMGEGKSYKASCKHLRPSLDWSPEHGWTVPIYKENGSFRRCARLIQPGSQDGGGGNYDVSTRDDASSVSSHGSAGSLSPPELLSHSPARRDVRKPSGGKIQKDAETNAVLSSHSQEREILKRPLGDNNKENESSSKKSNTETQNLSSHFPERKLLKQPSHDKNKENPETPELLYLHSSEREILKKRSGDDMAHKEKRKTPDMISMDMDIETGGVKKASFSDSVSITHDKDESVATRKTVACRDRYNSNVSLNMRTSETEVNSTCSDTIESSVMDLEELINRVKWLKGAIEYGFRFSNAMKPSWKFLETRASFAD